MTQIYGHWCRLLVAANRLLVPVTKGVMLRVREATHEVADRVGRAGMGSAQRGHKAIVPRSHRAGPAASRIVEAIVRLARRNLIP